VGGGSWVVRLAEALVPPWSPCSSSRAMAAARMPSDEASGWSPARPRLRVGRRPRRGNRRRVAV